MRSQLFTIDGRDVRHTLFLILGTGIYAIGQYYTTKHQLPDFSTSVTTILAQINDASPALGVYLLKLFCSNSDGIMAPEPKP